MSTSKWQNCIWKKPKNTPNAHWSQRKEAVKTNRKKYQGTNNNSKKREEINKNKNWKKE